MWRVKFRVYSNVPGQNEYIQYSEVEYYGNKADISYIIFNRISNTSARCFYYNNICRLNLTGYNASYSHILGVGLRSSTNPISSSYPRTFKIELLETENCTFTFYDSMKKIADITEYNTTNYTGITEYDAYSNGLRETGDDTNIWQLRRNGGNFIVSTALYRYMICLQKNETTLIPMNAVNNSIATTKTLTTDSFNPFAQILYYNSTTTISANASVGATALYEQVTLDLRYSFNTGTTLTAHKDVYLVAAPQSDGLAKLHTSPISQVLPTTADGLIYIYLGRAYSNYQIELHPIHPVYEYKDGALRQYTNSVGTTYEDATTTTHGLMSAADKVKLNGIATGAEVNVQSDWNATSGDALILNKPTIPTKTSDLTNDSDFMSGMTILAYGKSTWNDFITAYTKKHVVYCRASSNSNPASGSQTRMAFMAYVNNETNPTEVEFQYYRSVSSHSASQQGDQVYVYKLTSSGTWTVTVREAMSKIATGSNMSSSYASGTITLSATVPTKTSDLTNDSGFITNTDYASGTSAGVVRKGNGLDVSSTTGTTSAITYTYDQYNSTAGNGYFISKGTLNNVLSGRGYTTNTGTITGVSVNGTSVATSGVANLVTNTAYDASTNKLATMADVGGSVYANFAVETYTSAVVTIPNLNSTYSTTVSNITKEGYYPIGIVGSWTSTQAKNLAIRNLHLTTREIGSTSFYIVIQNTSTSALNITYSVDILWVKM